MLVRFSGLQNSPFDELWRVFEQMDEALAGGVSSSGGIRSLPRGSFPAVNVVQTPSEVQVYLFAPGVEAKQLDVSIQQGLLTITGRREIALEEKATYYRRERFGGEFSRAISLGEDVDAERVAAQYRDGILQITLHRRESARPRQIEIH